MAPSLSLAQSQLYPQVLLPANLSEGTQHGALWHSMALSKQQ